jgi:hypothetical protein
MNHHWTKEEDATLLDLVNTHGKQWGLIVNFIPERSASQIAARWEKCLDPNLHKGPFTPEEDQIVTNFVSQHGPRSWPQIVSLLPHRSAKQCRERWLNHLDPAIIKTEWSVREDEMIFDQVQTYGPKWSQIAKSFPGRSDNAIKNRWNSSISRRVQTDEKGRKVLLPDSAKRKYRPRERSPMVTSVETPQEVTETVALESKVERKESPVIPLSNFLLPTPVFPGILLSADSPLGLAPGGLGSPTRGLQYLLSYMSSNNDFK